MGDLLDIASFGSLTSIFSQLDPGGDHGGSLYYRDDNCGFLHNCQVDCCWVDWMVAVLVNHLLYHYL